MVSRSRFRLMTRPTATPWTFSFAAGAPESEASGRLDGVPDAIESFAGGVSAYAEGEMQTAIHRWREALAEDPANYLIRKQIWAVQHPERFYPKIDWDWQMEVLAQERDAESIGADRT